MKLADLPNSCPMHSMHSVQLVQTLYDGRTVVVVTHVIVVVVALETLRPICQAVYFVTNRCRNPAHSNAVVVVLFAINCTGVVVSGEQ